MNNIQAFCTAGVIALADSAVKGYIRRPPVKNFGFAGNKLDRYPGAVAGVSTVMTVVMCGALALAPERFKLPLSLILGGAVSNTVDRTVRGYVVDYIPMGRGVYGNISDFSIFAGSAIGAVKYLLEEDNEKDQGSSISGA